MVNSPFDFVNNINSSYEDILDAETEKQYNAYLINRAYSQFPDSIFYANVMNTAHNLPLRLQYDFYRFGLSKRKRFGKWPKASKPDDFVKAVAAYYDYSLKKASEIIDLISDDLKKNIIDWYKYKTHENE